MPVPLDDDSQPGEHSPSAPQLCNGNNNSTYIKELL